VPVRAACRTRPGPRREAWLSPSTRPRSGSCSTRARRNGAAGAHRAALAAGLDCAGSPRARGALLMAAMRIHLARSPREAGRHQVWAWAAGASGHRMSSRAWRRGARAANSDAQVLRRCAAHVCVPAGEHLTRVSGSAATRRRPRGRAGEEGSLREVLEGSTSSSSRPAWAAHRHRRRPRVARLAKEMGRHRGHRSPPLRVRGQRRAAIAEQGIQEMRRGRTRSDPNQRSSRDRPGRAHDDASRGRRPCCAVGSVDLDLITVPA